MIQNSASGYSERQLRILEEIERQSTMIRNIRVEEDQEEKQKAQDQKRVRKLVIDKVEQTKEMLSTVPYEIYGTDSTMPKREIAMEGYRFIERVFYLKRNFASLEKGKTINWNDRLSFLETFYEGVENGSIRLTEGKDLAIMNASFHRLKHFAATPEASRYFIESGSFMDILDYLYSSGHEKGYWKGRMIVKSFDILYDHEMDLKRQDEENGTTMFENFIAAPMEIKAPLLQCFDHLPEIKKR